MRAKDVLTDFQKRNKAGRRSFFQMMSKTRVGGPRRLLLSFNQFSKTRALRIKEVINF